MALYIVVVMVAAALAVALLYNRLIKLRNQSLEAWSGVDVQLRRRYDLIPNLVETVKGYAKHEQETLQNTINARHSALSTSTLPERARAEEQLAGALSSLVALAEAYPDLKANQSFSELQKSLSDIEENLQLARRFYNAVVRDLNIACESFPSILVARAFGFKKRQFFEIGAHATAPVSISSMHSQETHDDAR